MPERTYYNPKTVLRVMKKVSFAIKDPPLKEMDQ